MGSFASDSGNPESIYFSLTGLTPFCIPLVVAGFLIHFRPGQLRFFIAQFFGSPFTRPGGERKTVGFWIRGRRALHRGAQQFLSWPSGARKGRAPWIGCPRGELLRRQVA